MFGSIEEMAERIADLYIDCPVCEFMSSDDQYTCTTCWCMGGNGRIRVGDILKESPEVVKRLTTAST